MKILISTVLFFSLFTFVRAAPIANPETSSEEKTIDVREFRKLKLSGVFQVTLVQGNKNQVVIEAPKKFMKKIKVDEKGSSLEISMSKRVNINNPDKIEITIYFTDMQELETSFVGSLESDGKLKLKTLKWDNSCVGNVDLELDVDFFEADISAVGQITLSGSAIKADIENSMVGDFYAKDFIVEDMDIDNSSVGQCTIRAENELAIEHSGMGNFYYSGDAKITSLSSSGMGKVKKR